ncbi:Ig-like domain-containing protein [Leadbettera azotonutricia]|uniref:Ig domain protein, group 2 domain protein n=1 Tax=Leadbettera azotonutricia (strain ATCC BAA-888 / DSM 13862 / ZAS-9) TaxID=545695 RepID=F5YDQ3_LEAAZ|nr:Ig-like domain-containing protein [Leadbettera azotonutricia]AEF82401.1 Ig domain protein, group 2 domain protein [Leadbettera azotonutricia ZAS-9]
MKMKKKVFAITISLAMAALMLIMGCSSPYAGSEDVSAAVGTGTVSVALEAGSARTVLPGLNFEKYEFTFIPQGWAGAEQIFTRDNLSNLNFTLPVGNYKVKVETYNNNLPAGEGTSAVFTITAGASSGTIVVKLAGTISSGNGTFVYSIGGIPTGATINEFKLGNIDLTETSGTITSPAGYQFFVIRLTDAEGKVAGFADVVAIYANNTTTLSVVSNNRSTPLVFAADHFKAVPVTSIFAEALGSKTLSTSAATVALKATVFPKNATSNTVKWVSLDPDVAIVGETSGIVTPKTNGTAKIIATADGISSNEIDITVDFKVTGITIVAEGGPLSAAGNTVTLKETVTPDKAKVKDVDWSSSDPAIATVNPITGIVTAVANGTATITATAKDGSGVTGTIPVTVDIKVTKITVSAKGGVAPIVLTAASPTVELEALVEPLGAKVKDVTWTTSNSAIADVDANGKVTGTANISNGTAKITATAKDGSGISSNSIDVTVNTYITSGEKGITGITVNGVNAVKDGSAYTADIGTNATANVLATPASGKAAVWYKLGTGDYQPDGNFEITASGTYTITIKVTAEDDTTAEYTLTVSKSTSGTGPEFDLQWDNPKVIINKEYSGDGKSVTLTAETGHAYEWVVDGWNSKSTAQVFTFTFGEGTFITLYLDGATEHPLSTVITFTKLGVEL